MKKKRTIVRSVKMAALKRASDRRAKSCFLVVIFFAIFAMMVITEVFYVEEERWKEEKLLSMFTFGDDSIIQDSNRFAIMPPAAARVARELSIVKEGYLNETKRTGYYVTNSALSAMNMDSGDYWQRVPNTKDKFFIYSAYYDERRTTKWVRVIAAARTRMADKVLCQFSFKDTSKTPITVMGINRLIRENWNLKYSAYFILCPLKQTPIADFVTIIRQGDTTLGNKVIVHDNKRMFVKSKGTAVCIKPLHYEYNKVKNLIEFIELNRILGVDHFVLYNHTVGKEVECILEKYQSEGIVTVLPWQLDIVSQKEIRTEGLFAALNDCLYRTMYKFKYVLMIDLDEYIIPHKNTSLSLMLEHLYKKNPDRTGSYSFQNAFFYLQWPNDTSTNLPYKLLTLQKTIRKTKFHAHKQRSKCIVLPERVIEMGNHFVWEFVAGKTMMNVPPDLAFLHHYRVCEFGGNDCINTTHVTDRRVYTWKDPLTEAVALRLRLLQPICQDVPKLLLE